MNGANKIQKAIAIDQLDGFSLRELFGIGSERTDANDFHRIGAVVYQQPPHFAHDRDFDLSGLPLLALHEILAPGASEDQIDATILAASAGFLYGVA